MGWLVAGEETRSREAGQDTEMATRHLMLSGAALRAFASGGPGVGDGGKKQSHGRHTFVCP
jgi:hypothetical protein